MENVGITITQVMILVLEIGVGYVLAKKGKIPESALGIMNFLCCNVALPCSIILSVSSMEGSAEVWRSVSSGFVVILASTAVQMVASRFLFRKAERDRRVVYQMATIYGNSAYMGIPVVTAVAGPEAVIYVTLMMITDTVFLFTHGALAATGERPSVSLILSKIFSLVTVALLIGLGLCVTGIQIPGIIRTCMTDFRGMLTPLAMLIVGCQLAGQDFLGIFRQKDYYKVAAVKLIIWPAVLMACLYPLKALILPAAVTAIVICKATPQAAVLGVLAENSGLDGKAAAGVVGLNTLLAIVTLPVMAGICGMLF